MTCSHPPEYRQYSSYFNTGSWDEEAQGHIVDYKCEYCGLTWVDRVSREFIKTSGWFKNSHEFTNGWWETNPTIRNCGYVYIVLDGTDKRQFPEQLELEWK